MLPTHELPLLAIGFGVTTKTNDLEAAAAMMDSVPALGESAKPGPPHYR